MPASAGSSAPRSIAGTARSSSGPSARPVSDDPDRMEQRLPLLTGLRLHLAGDRAKPLAIEPRRRRQLLGERARPPRARPARSSPRGRRGRRAPRRHRSRTGTASRAGNLVEPIDRRRGHRHRAGEKLEPPPVGVIGHAGLDEIRRRPAARGAPASADLQVVAVHPRQLLLVEHAGAVADVVERKPARQLVDRQQLVASLGRPWRGDQPMSAR